MHTQMPLDWQYHPLDEMYLIARSREHLHSIEMLIIMKRDETVCTPYIPQKSEQWPNGSVL